MTSAPLKSSASDMADLLISCEQGKLFVGGLSWETDIVSLHNYMSQFGNVSEVCIKMDSMTGRSRGFGFVKFKAHEDATKVLNQKTHILDAKAIDPKPALPAVKHISNKTKIFVGGLKSETTETILNDYFSQFGKIFDIEFFYDKITKKRRGFCFIEFRDDESAERSLENIFHIVADKKLEVKPAFTREQQHIMAIRGMWPPAFHINPSNLSQLSLLSEPNNIYNMPYSYPFSFYPVNNNNFVISPSVYPAIQSNPIIYKENQMNIPIYMDYNISEQNISAHIQSLNINDTPSIKKTPMITSLAVATAETTNNINTNYKAVNVYTSATEKNVKKPTEYLSNDSSVSLSSLVFTTSNNSKRKRTAKKKHISKQKS